MQANTELQANDRDSSQPKSELNDPMSNFYYGLRSSISQDKYQRRLQIFFDFILDNQKDKSSKENENKNEMKSQAIKFMKMYNINKKGPEWVESNLIRYISEQNSRVKKGEITAGTVRNYYKPIKLFCEMNRIVVNWKIITRGMLKEKQYGEDRAPTTDEIIQLMKYPDRRIKPIILVMVSSGIRAGAWDYLKWKHIIPIERNNQVVAAKVIVYAGEPESYYSLITPEAYHSCLEWMDFRSSYGEKITGESWLMRDLWQTTTTRNTVGKNLGSIETPKQLKSSGIKSMLQRAITSQGINTVKTGTNRYNCRREWKVMHGFRKAFNGILINSNFNFTKKEMLMGHSLPSLDNNYFKPTDEEMLSEYLEKAINNLTFSEEFRLKQKIETLTIEKSKVDFALASIEEMKKKIGIL